MAAKRKNTRQGDSSVRIIGGQWRGRKLKVGTEEGLRPSGDRMRETLFNWLMPYISDSVCLDAFAGTGALGFEALSRGAYSTHFIEQNSNSVAHLKENTSTLNANATIYCDDFLHWQATNAQDSFDIVFLDPPFSNELWGQAFAHVITHIPLSDDALIYIEAPSAQVLHLPNEWSIHREKQFGQVKAVLCKTSSRKAR